MVGCMEALAIVLYTSSGTIFVAQMLTFVFRTEKRYEALWWASIYILCSVLCSCGSHIFWKVTKFLAIISYLVIVMYIAGLIPFANFGRENDSQYFVGGTSFLQGLPSVLWLFIGVEYANTATRDCLDPKKVIHRGAITGYVSLLIAAVCVVLLTLSVSPAQEVKSSLAPLNAGFVKLFGCGNIAACILSLPASFATVYGFVYVYGRIIHALGQGNILPPFLGLKLLSSSAPDVAIWSGSLLGFIFCCIFQFSPQTAVPDVFQLCVMFSCVSYCCFFASAYHFSLNFTNSPPPFRSPMGRVGAIIGSLIFSLVLISVVFFQPHFSTAITFFAISLLLTAHYLLVVRHRQFFCSEEQEIFFKCYVSKGE